MSYTSSADPVRSRSPRRCPAAPADTPHRSSATAFRARLSGKNSQSRFVETHHLRAHCRERILDLRGQEVPVLISHCARIAFEMHVDPPTFFEARCGLQARIGSPAARSRAAAIVATMASCADGDAGAPLSVHHSATPPRITGRIVAARLIESFIAPASRTSVCDPRVYFASRLSFNLSLPRIVLV